ncbi:hypothetical protein D6817_00485 [Candidatus Pacearchaeota archaeon]|nr:MAG: hypothetical protein D6817_00485 [Candidatus Pacearchaeota archaeon]
MQGDSLLAGERVGRKGWLVLVMLMLVVVLAGVAWSVEVSAQAVGPVGAAQGGAVANPDAPFARASASTSFSSSTGTGASFVTRQEQATYQPTGSLLGRSQPINERDICVNRGDLILNVRPFSCKPQVVRSDLLEEQDVQVFCELDAVKANPLLDAITLRNVRIKADAPPEVRGTAFRPAKAALRRRSVVLDNPLYGNLGYVVIVLKRQPVEARMPDSVTVNFSVELDYSATNAFGVGREEFMLSPTTDEEWERTRFQGAFWRGKYFLRLEDVDNNRARVSVYDGREKIASAVVNKGELSRPIYLRGSFCNEGLQIAYDELISDEPRAEIEVTQDFSTDKFLVGEREKFFGNKCIATDLQVNEDGVSGSVKVRCGTRSFTLSIGNALGKDVHFEFRGKQYAPKFESGKYVLDLRDIESKWNGTYELGENNELFWTPSKVGRIEKVIDENNRLKSEFSSGKQFFDLVRAKLVEFKNAREETSQESKIEPGARAYYDKAIANYERVADEYTKARDPSGRFYGERALRNAIELARAFGDTETMQRLTGKYSRLYPDGDYVEEFKREVDKRKGLDYSGSVATIQLNGKETLVRLTGFHMPQERSTATFVFANEQRTLARGGRVGLYLDDKKVADVVLREVGLGRAKIDAYCVRDGRIADEPVSYNLREDGGSVSVCGKMSATLLHADVASVAKLRVLPFVGEGKSVGQFDVTIGIEKRAFKLNTLDALEKINSLNRTIAKWQRMSDQLGQFVSGMKGACLATSMALSFKNFLGGLNGESLARQEVMSGDNGWKAKCEEWVSQGRYVSMTACYNAHAGEIDGDVARYAGVINRINAEINAVQARHQVSSGGGLFNLFGGSAVDSDKVREELARIAKRRYGDLEIDVSSLPHGWTDASGKQKDKVKVSELLSDENVKNGLVTTDAVRSIMLYGELKRSGGVSEVQRANLDDKLKEVAGLVNNNRIVYSSMQKREQLVSEGFARPLVLSSFASKATPVNVVPAARVANKLSFSPGVTHTTSVIVSAKNAKGGGTFDSGTYILGLTEADPSKGYFLVKDVYLKKGNEFEKLPPELAKEFANTYNLGLVRAAESVGYHNPIAKQDRVVRYFENEPYKGMPAIVPFDLERGWYAATKQTLPVFGGIGAFDASGKVVSFWLCNVGENGRIEFEKGIGDDVCQQINLNTGQPLGVFPGLSASEARALVDKAVRAVQDAANAYGSGKRYVRVAGTQVEVGKPAVGKPETQCQDFMSPTDCLILFNVCDPVICPPSRCDLGGQYPVADVVQTGIIGSLVLCLPNIKEGVAIPICLTGVKAGLDGYISILKNYRDCLQAHVETGQMLGLCDQLYSVYLCDFFWGQIGPLMDVLIPKLLETMYGQGVRGGAEYLTVNAAWQNMQKSMNYFTQSYAGNSFKAFNLRTGGKFDAGALFSGSISLASGEICKSFVSQKAPAVFEALVEPDSPPQFYAYFDQRPFNDAQVPARAHYKVFYHIYAGNDFGVQYMVYLRNPPSSSYYAISPRQVVATGFIPRGEYASQTKDFTAPAGYKELCVRINNQEECGFKQVTSNFALNYLKDSFAKQEIERRQITSEKECVSGSTNAFALLNPNLQSAAEEALNPNVYERGIIRICSTQNPGLGTDPTRFVDVGYCDNKKVRCWLDKSSVDNALSTSAVGMKNQTLAELDALAQRALEKQGLLSNEESLAALVEMERRIEGLVPLSAADAGQQGIELSAQLDELFNKVLLDTHKAGVVYLKGRLNEILARKNFRGVGVTREPKSILKESVVGARGETGAQTEQGAQTPSEQRQESRQGGRQEQTGENATPAAEGNLNFFMDGSWVRVDITANGTTYSYALNESDALLFYASWEEWIDVFKDPRAGFGKKTSQEKQWLVQLRIKMIDFRDRQSRSRDSRDATGEGSAPTSTGAGGSSDTSGATADSSSGGQASCALTDVHWENDQGQEIVQVDEGKDVFALVEFSGDCSGKELEIKLEEVGVVWNPDINTALYTIKEGERSYKVRWTSDNFEADNRYKFTASLGLERKESQELEVLSAGGAGACQLIDAYWEEKDTGFKLGKELPPRGRVARINQPLYMVAKLSGECAGKRVGFLVKKNQRFWADSEVSDEMAKQVGQSTNEGEFIVKKEFEFKDAGDYYFLVSFYPSGEQETRADLRVEDRTYGGVQDSQFFKTMAFSFRQAGNGEYRLYYQPAVGAGLVDTGIYAKERVLKFGSSAIGTLNPHSLDEMVSRGLTEIHLSVSSQFKNYTFDSDGLRNVKLEVLDDARVWRDREPGTLVLRLKLAR